jgi:AMMECR1 domain-containing protein
MYNIIDLAIDYGLEIKSELVNTTYELKLISDAISDKQVFGIFVSVERSIYHAKNKDNIHGCIGYFDHSYQPLVHNILCTLVKKKAYSTTWNDSRRYNFDKSIYLDIDAEYKIYFMLYPIIKINNNGIMENGVVFNNIDYGLIVKTADNQATYLPGVYSDKSWDFIKEQLIEKAGGGEHINFVAYKTIVVKKTLRDYLISPINNFINMHYGEFIPYTINNDIKRDKNEYVRNIATMYDILMMKKYGYAIRIRDRIKNNLNYYKKIVIPRQASIFVSLVIHVFNSNDPLIKKINNDLYDNLDNMEPNFELGEALYALAITDSNNKLFLENKLTEIMNKESKTIDVSDIFRYNWLSKFSQKLNIINDKLVESVIYCANNISKRVTTYETNYLAVTLEAITSLLTIKSNDELESFIEPLFIELNKRKNNYGLYTFKNNEARLDITGHVLNCYYNMIDINTKILSGGSKLEYYKNKLQYYIMKYNHTSIN